MKKTIFFTYCAAILAAVGTLFFGGVEVLIDFLNTLCSSPEGGVLLCSGALAAGAVVTDGDKTVEDDQGNLGTEENIAEGKGDSAVTPTTKNMEEAGLIDADLDKDITLINPDRYPLDTMIRNLTRRNRKAAAQKVKYAERSFKPLADMLYAQAAGDGSSAASPASAYAGSEEMEFIYIRPLNPEMWRRHDTLLMRGLSVKGNDADELVINGAETFLHDQMFYVEEKDGYTLKLRPIGGMRGTGANAKKYVVPNFTKETMLYRMGQAKSELAITTDPFAINPELFEQFLQNFMAQIEESTFQAITGTKKVDWGFSDYEADNIDSMRAEMEMSFLFGDKHELRVGNDSTLFTGGITRAIDKHLEYGDGTEGGKLKLTKEQYTAWLVSLFTRNSGSKDRVLMAGAELLAAIELLSESDKTISGSREQETYLGVKTTKIVSTLGTLHIVHAPLFDETGWSDHGLALDFQHIYKKEFVKLHATQLDLIKSGQKNAKAKVLQEVSGMVLRYPDCHAIVAPKAAA